MNAFKMLCLKPDILESIFLLEKYSVYMHGIFHSQSQLTHNLSIFIPFLAILILLCRFGSSSHFLNKCAKAIHIFTSLSVILTRNLSIFMIIIFLAILILLCSFGSPSHFLNKCAKAIHIFTYLSDILTRNLSIFIPFLAILI